MMIIKFKKKKDTNVRSCITTKRADNAPTKNDTDARDATGIFYISQIYERAETSLHTTWQKGILTTKTPSSNWKSNNDDGIFTDIKYFSENPFSHMIQSFPKVGCRNMRMGEDKKKKSFKINHEENICCCILSSVYRQFKNQANNFTNIYIKKI